MILGRARHLHNPCSASYKTNQNNSFDVFGGDLLPKVAKCYSERENRVILAAKILEAKKVSKCQEKSSLLTNFDTCQDDANCQLFRKFFDPCQNGANCQLFRKFSANFDAANANSVARKHKKMAVDPPPNLSICFWLNCGCHMSMIRIIREEEA